MVRRPSRIVVDKKTGDLIVSDTGNNRVLIVDKDSSVIKRTIGNFLRQLFQKFRMS